MEILDIKAPKHYGYEMETVVLTVLNKYGEEKIIHVQTEGGLYREDLGFLICACDGSELNKDDFNDYEASIKEIIKKTEEYLAINNTYTMEENGRDICSDYSFRIYNSKVVLVKYKGTWPKYAEIESFKTIEEARNYLNAMLEGKIKCKY